MGLNQVQDAGDHISYGPKGSLSKKLKDWKETFVNKHMFGNVVAPEEDLYPLSHPRQLYELDHNAVQSLGPGSWLFEHVIDAYMLLLRDREEYYRSRGIQRWSQFGFMNSFFMHLGQNYVPLTNANTAWSFCNPYVNQDVGPPLHECKYIFMPVCSTNQRHFVLFLFSVEDWMVTIVDPHYNDTTYIKLHEMYSEFVKVAVCLVLKYFNFIMSFNIKKLLTNYFVHAGTFDTILFAKW